MPPGDLDRALCGLQFPTDDNVLIGLKRADDAGVYKVSDELALIQTVDFFTPIVDDPYWFGQIAVANALSDVYAMGGEPKTAMNLVAFPIQDLDISVLRQIIQGGIDKLQEAGVVLLGGHSVEDKELKYGLSVTGFVHPERILGKKDLCLGDKLILTKPLGTGIISTGIKAKLAPNELVEEVTALMALLNKIPAQIMTDFAVHACTDVTGFGLLGHLAEMVQGSGFGVRIQSFAVPVLGPALEFANMGLVPAGAYKNREFAANVVKFDPKVEQAVQDVLFDPQTSGGLLLSVSPDQASPLLTALKKGTDSSVALIGEVVSGPERIEVC